MFPYASTVKQYGASLLDDYHRSNSQDPNHGPGLYVSDDSTRLVMNAAKRQRSAEVSDQNTDANIRKAMMENYSKFVDVMIDSDVSRDISVDTNALSFGVKFDSDVLGDGKLKSYAVEIIKFGVSMMAFNIGPGNDTLFFSETDGTSPDTIYVAHLSHGSFSYSQLVTMLNTAMLAANPQTSSASYNGTPQSTLGFSQNTYTFVLDAIRHTLSLRVAGSLKTSIHCPPTELVNTNNTNQTGRSYNKTNYCSINVQSATYNSTSKLLTIVTEGAHNLTYGAQITLNLISQTTNKILNISRLGLYTCDIASGTLISSASSHTIVVAKDLDAVWNYATDDNTVYGTLQPYHCVNSLWSMLGFKTSSCPLTTSVGGGNIFYGQVRVIGVYTASSNCLFITEKPTGTTTSTNIALTNIGTLSNVAQSVNAVVDGTLSVSVANSINATTNSAQLSYGTVCPVDLSESTSLSSSTQVMMYVKSFVADTTFFRHIKEVSYLSMDINNMEIGRLRAIDSHRSDAPIVSKRFVTTVTTMPPPTYFVDSANSLKTDMMIVSDHKNTDLGGILYFQEPISKLQKVNLKLCDCDTFSELVDTGAKMYVLLRFYHY